jgi:hypothetical protein
MAPIINHLEIKEAVIRPREGNLDVDGRGRIMPDDHEIEDLRRQERSRRGRRPVDIEARRQRQRYLSALRKIVEEGTEDDLKLALRQIGLSEDSPEYAEALRIWRGGCR